MTDVSFVCHQNAPFSVVCRNILLDHLILQALRNYRYDEDPVLAECGIFIEKQLVQVDGRILETPKVT